MKVEKGWFKIPGIRPHGDRSIEEQSLGLGPALAEAPGKTVLDLGCAEGAIARQFAIAGASAVLGVEMLEAHLAIARKYCKGTRVKFLCAHLADHIVANPVPDKYDIVLALGIIHKLEDPAVPLQFAARSCKSLLLYRASANAECGVIKSKFSDKRCDVPVTLVREGFREEQLIEGVRGEAVQYWRRIK